MPTVGRKLGKCKQSLYCDIVPCNSSTRHFGEYHRITPSKMNIILTPPQAEWLTRCPAIAVQLYLIRQFREQHLAFFVDG